MGLTFLEAEVANPSTPENGTFVQFLVDSGAVYSVVPARVLEGQGIRPVAEETFVLANGERIIRRKGVALFRYRDRVGGADVIFGEDADATLIGVLTLEALGFALDPLRRELRPLPMTH